MDRADLPVLANGCRFRRAADHIVLEFSYTDRGEPDPAESSPRAPVTVARLAVPIAAGFDVAIQWFSNLILAANELQTEFVTFQQRINDLNKVSERIQQDRRSSPPTGTPTGES